MSGEQVEVNRELVGQGMANAAAGAFGGLPSSGSFVRSFTAYAAGGRTRFTGLFAGGFVMLAIAILGDLGRWLPRSALAGLVIYLAMRMLRFDRLRLAFRATKSDAAVVLLTFLAALFFRLDAAIYCGVGLSLAMFLKKASSPYLREYSFEEDGGFREIHDAADRRFAGIAIIHVEGDLFFGAAELFENEVKTLARDREIRGIILRMRGARYLDATALVALGNLNAYLRSRGQHLLLCGIGDRVEQILHNSGLAARIGEEYVFHARDGVLESTRRALKKAQELAEAAGEKPKIRLFYDRKRPGDEA
jgi:SulP family sulfate permease